MKMGKFEHHSGGRGDRGVAHVTPWLAPAPPPSPSFPPTRIRKKESGGAAGIRSAARAAVSRARGSMKMDNFESGVVFNDDWGRLTEEARRRRWAW
jgi:hypothetical protein